jgi:ketosteroid isomerase-like protein
LLHKAGWAEIGPAFDFLASRFSNCRSFEYQVISAGSAGDLGYIVGIERTTASVGGAPPEAYSLRVTTLLRRENGEWKIFHRHADPLPESSSANRQLARFGPEKRVR